MTRLIKVSLQAPPGLSDFLAEMREGELGITGLADLASGTLRVQVLLERLVDYSQGHSLLPGWVPMTIFWLLDGSGSVVAASSLRHLLNPYLLIHSGHIGYRVKASERGSGYGTQILAHTLREARSLGLDRVLLTVDSDNEPSIRVIERNAGVLENELIDETTGRLHRRYWITLT